MIKVTNEEVFTMNVATLSNLDLRVFGMGCLFGKLEVLFGVLDDLFGIFEGLFGKYMNLFGIFHDLFGFAHCLP